jgi:hypothetical protein
MEIGEFAGTGAAEIVASRDLAASPRKSAAGFS